jgi:uncharacterized protein (TIGR03435 family)
MRETEESQMIESLDSQFWLQKLGWTLLHFLWQGTAIVVVYLIVRAIAGRLLSARGRYAMACLALIAMVVSPLFTFPWLPNTRDANPDSLPALPLHVTVSEWQRLLPLLVLVWVAGVTGFSIRLVGGWRFTSRLRAKTAPAPSEWQSRMETIAAQVGVSLIGAGQPVRLMISAAVNVPTVIGWLRPVILFPVSALSGLPAEHIVALLAHELAHVRRLDYLANVAQSVAEAVFFYHPAVWWISRQIREERELCCDDIAVEITGDALMYAGALAKLETSRRRRVETALAASGGSLLNRVRRLVEPAHPITDDLPGAAAVVAMALLWFLGAGVAVLQAADQPLPRQPVALIDEVSDAKPNPFARAKDTLLFDPFLSAQLPVAREIASHAAPDGPNFLLADVRPSVSPAGSMEGGFYGHNRLDVQSAQMVDLIGLAYGIGRQNIFGGPDWMETDRFDVSALAPESSSAVAMRQMLQTLLAKRFGLVVRNETRDRPAWVLGSGMTPHLTPFKAAVAAGSGDSGCKPELRRSQPEGSSPAFSVTYSYTCRDVTMAAFADVLRKLVGNNPDRVVDQTGIDGGRDFNFQFTFRMASRAADIDPVRVAALAEALEKQLGLKLDIHPVPTPVLAVGSANRQPSPDAPGEAAKLVASYPTAFEVADIKPSESDVSVGFPGGFQPGGLITTRGVTLRYLILVAWKLNPAELAGGPKFLDTNRFDLIARAPAGAVSDSGAGVYPVDVNAMRLMLRSLLASRFGLTTHFEDRPVPGFTLTASKPKLAQADPGNRTGFHDLAATGAKDPRVLNPAITRVVMCQNMTMADFAQDLPVIASGYFGDVSRNVIDKTGLDGAYDFTFAFSGASTLSSSAASAGVASDPTGQVSLFEAVEKLGLRLEKEKRAAPVLVIDQLSEMPTGN